MKAKKILFICIIGLIIFAGLTVTELVNIGNAVEKTLQTVKETIANDTLIQRLKKENIRLASADIANQIVARLPDDIHFRLLAIGPISGDSDRLVEALTAKIKAETNYHLIERKDLNRLLEEQGIQLSPIADTRRPIEPGRIKGVEGLILGRLEARHASFAGCSLEAFIKLDDVEGGDVVFAETFTANHVPKHTAYGAIAVIFLILLIFCANRLKKRKTRKIARVVETDSGILVRVQDELHKAKNRVNQAHDHLVARNLMQSCVAVRQARDDLGYLLDRVGQTPAVYRETVNKATKSGLKTHGKQMQGLVKNVLAESGKLHEVVKTGEETEIQAVAERLRAEINHALARFQERPVGKS